MGIEPLSLDTYLTNAAKKAGFTLKGTTPRNPVTQQRLRHELGLVPGSTISRSSS